MSWWLDIAITLAVIWASVAATATLFYCIHCGADSKPFRASAFAAGVLWPITVTLLVIRGAREACAWALYGDEEGKDS